MMETLLGRKSIFRTLNGINDFVANPGQASILRTKSVARKQMNTCMAEILGPDRIRTSDLVHIKLNTITQS